MDNGIQFVWNDGPSVYRSGGTCLGFALAGYGSVMDLALDPWNVVAHGWEACFGVGSRGRRTPSAIAQFLNSTVRDLVVVNGSSDILIGSPVREFWHAHLGPPGGPAAVA